METWIELFGYLGSAMVVASMLMTSVVRLRVINMIGSVISGTYAMIIGSFPLALMNFCLIAINAFNLYQLLKTERNYDLLLVKPDDTVVLYFLRKNLPDIQRYFPEYKLQTPADIACMVFCNSTPAGIFLAKRVDQEQLEAMLDYTTQAYRDCSVGSFLYAELKRLGVNRLLVSGHTSPEHAAYLRKMNFEVRNGMFAKKLNK